MKQLDLFDQPSHAPAQARSSVVRLAVSTWGPSLWRPRVARVADVLARKPSDKARQTYWDQSCRAIIANLAKYGATPAEIQKELGSFYTAVDLEMASHCRSGPGVA